MDRKMVRISSGDFGERAPEGVVDKINNDIEFLKTVTFKGQENIGIILFRSKEIYTPTVGTPGNVVWAIIRGNDLDTIFFTKNNQVPGNTQIHFPIERLRKYVELVKNGDKNIESKELNRIVNFHEDMVDNTPKNKQVVFKINGVNYILSDDKEYLVKKNNPNSQEKIAVDDALGYLNDEEGEALLTLLERC